MPREVADAQHASRVLERTHGRSDDGIEHRAAAPRDEHGFQRSDPSAVVARLGDLRAQALDVRARKEVDERRRLSEQLVKRLPEERRGAARSKQRERDSAACAGAHQARGRRHAGQQRVGQARRASALEHAGCAAIAKAKNQAELGAAPMVNDGPETDLLRASLW